MASVGFDLIPRISEYKQIYGLGRQLWRFSTGRKKFIGYYFRLDSLKFTGIFHLWVIPTFNSLNSLIISKGPKIFHQDSYSKHSGISVSGETEPQKGQGVCLLPGDFQVAEVESRVKLQHRTFLDRCLFNDGSLYLTESLKSLWIHEMMEFSSLRTVYLWFMEFCFLEK